MTAPTRPFGYRWGVAYALFTPPAPVCGFILNPDAARIAELRFCFAPAVYGFRFGDRDPRDIGDALGGWQGACAHHAAVMRERGEVAEMWSL